jgi:ADP-heptose:LPS heptosyltransferase
LGIYWNNEQPRIYLTSSEIHWAKSFFAEHNIVSNDQLIMTIDPTHRRSTRCWPAKHYARLINLLAEKIHQFAAILLYGPGEKGEVEEIANLSNIGKQCLVPKTILSLREMAAIIHLADLHLGNCSAPSHFAAALDTPSLTIKGSTSSAWTNPASEHEDISLNLPCQPCNKDVCPYGNNQCLHELSPQKVLNAVLKKIHKIR